MFSLILAPVKTLELPPCLMFMWNQHRT